VAANAAWTPAFFAVRSPPLAIAVSIVLLTLIVFTMRSFARVRRPAAWLMAPYLAWTCYATYLTIGFWWLNPS
jgi:tryptophan-rich sensory protein